MGRIIFSAIQPTGIAHLGNYFGAIKPWINLVKCSDPSDKFIFCIADMHSWTTTTSVNSSTSKNNRFSASSSPSLEMAAMLLACGLDPVLNDERLILFRQSDVPLHASLMWLLSCLVPMGRLDNMTQWKAADILLYRATDVPVGEDQVQHLELCRDLARRLGSGRKSSPVVSPRTLLTEALGCRRIKSLRNPSQKMSKSDSNMEATIFLTDSNDDVKRKISRAVTDSLSGISYDVKDRPGLANLLSIYAAVKEEPDVHALITSNNLINMGKAEFKGNLSQLLVHELDPIRTRYGELCSRDFKKVSHILQFGSDVANRIARNTWNDICNKPTPKRCGPKGSL